MKSNINDKIFAFFGVDIENVNEGYLESLFNEGYSIFALDSKAIEFASQSKISYLTIFDWIPKDRYLEIEKNAWNYEKNWFIDTTSDFTIFDICWPEYDHYAMHHFWLDAVISFELTKIFRKFQVTQLLLVDSNEEKPVIYYTHGSICKYIWKRELSDIISILNVSLTNTSTGIEKKQIQSEFYNCIFSHESLLKDKIAFFASGIEICRSNELIHDLSRTFPDEWVLLPNDLFNDDIHTLLIPFMNAWKIPIIAPHRVYKGIDEYSSIFIRSLKKNTALSKGKEWEYYLETLAFHFEYYCQYRWPKLISYYLYYCNLFSKFPPKIIIGSLLNFTEWKIPITAGKKKGIPTVSIPHSVSMSYSMTVINSFPVNEYSYHFYIDKFSRDLLISCFTDCEKKLIPCRNCTDINSHCYVKDYDGFDKSLFKILVLFSPTSSYRYPETQSRLIYFSKDPKKQIAACKDLMELAKKNTDKISMKFKFHPAFTELEIFQSLDKDFFENIVPLNTELLPILSEVNLVIGVNYYGSALIHTLKMNTPFINYMNDEIMEDGFYDEREPLMQLRKSMKIVSNKSNLIDEINKMMNDPTILEGMKSLQAKFVDAFLRNDNFPTIEEQMQLFLQEH